MSPYEQQHESDAPEDDGRQQDEEASLTPMGELLAYLARGLVDQPEDVSVEEFDEDDGTLVLELCVGEGDYGKVIGRGGRTAQALRTVVRAAATPQRRRVVIDIVD